jgi:uncharacterized membrane protein YeaQ/YmgE (transglycosylase-associated protein family)
MVLFSKRDFQNRDESELKKSLYSRENWCILLGKFTKICFKETKVMLHILGQLILGLIIGAVARLLLPGKEAIASGIVGWLITAGIGIGGSFVGTMIGKALFKENYAAGWIMSILGAIGLLFIYRMIF